MLPTYFDINNKCFPFTIIQKQLFDLQKQIENDGDEYDDPVDTQYIGNKNITTAVKNLKAELIRVRSDATQIVSGGKCIEETVVANQAESSGDKDNEIIILEHEEEETMMDC